MADYKEYIVRVCVYPKRTEWYQNDQLHREDGPAVEFANGEKYWYQNGVLHREDGPASEWSGNKSWYQKGERHREDGPAVEEANGTKAWYQNGLLHREDGPACEYANGKKCWYIKGKKLSEQEFKNRNKKEFSMDEIAKALGVDVSELKIKKD